MRRAPQAACAGRSPRALRHERIDERAEAVDLDTHALTGPHPRRGRRRTRRKHIARRERHEFGHIGQQPPHPTHEVRGAGRLRERAVHVGPHDEGARIVNRGARCDPRPERTESVSRLVAHGGPEVARMGHAHVVHDEVARDVIERSRLRHAAGGAADDYPEARGGLEFQHSAGNLDARAADRERIARLQVEDRGPRQCVVGRFSGLLRHRIERGALIQERAVDRARQPERGHLAGDPHERRIHPIALPQILLIC